MILHQHITMIIQHVTLLVHAFPLSCAVCHEIHYPLIIEHVAGRGEGFSTPFRVDVLYQRGEEENHVATFVHDRRAAVRAADFAGKVVRYVFVCWVVPAQVMMPVGEVYVGFVEDGCPLEGCL